MINRFSKTSSFTPFNILFLILLLSSCVEPIEIDTAENQNILVVEGIITNENINQEIKLSRTTILNTHEKKPVSGAEISVTSSDNDIYEFEETSPGLYHSILPFSISIGTDYTLTIETENEIYKSSPERINSTTKIDRIISEKGNYRNQNGIGISAISSEDDEDSKYFKYEYEETYEIHSPVQRLFEYIINEDNEIELVQKHRQDTICYVTENSKEIVLFNPSLLEDGRQHTSLVRFLTEDDYKIAYEYSVLVKQMKVSAEVYSYYSTLKELSESENVFSQYQPGFLNGNIYSPSNEDVKVIGYFSTASVDEKRHSFRYSDFYEGNNGSSDHIRPCLPFPSGGALRLFLEEGSGQYYGEGGRLVSPRCTDCTHFGPNEPPDFWDED